MIIYLCYGYHPNTTAVYFERALRKQHEVYYIGPGYGAKPGYDLNVDVGELIRQGLPAPDLVLFIESGVPFFPRGLETISCPTACYLIDVHLTLRVREQYAPFFDILFVAQRDYVKHFKDLGYRQVHWLPLACDPEIHGRQSTEKRFDVGFVGAMNSEMRRQCLTAFESTFSMNDWRAHYPKDRIAEVYSQSRIVFNNAINGDVNMRVFEAMASGSMLLTEAVGNGQSDLFQNGTHLVEYSSPEQAMDLARQYLNDPATREKIARAGELEVLERHTYEQRCRTILATVQTAGMQPGSAAVRSWSKSEVHRNYSDIYALFRRVDPVLDEFESAWTSARSRPGLAIHTAFYALKAFARRINHVVRLTGAGRSLVASLRRAASGLREPRTKPM